MITLGSGKEQIAFVQSYFAVQTRKQELREEKKLAEKSGKLANE